MVGIDFGTSGTKVAFRDFGDSRRVPTLIDFGTRLEGYCRFSLPSSVRITGGRVIVGEEAERAPAEDGIIRSPKMGLLRPNGRVWPGASDGPDTPGRDDVASALVVASAIRRTADAIQESLGNGHGELLFNIDVPVEDAEDSDVCGRFRRVLSAGIYFASELDECPKLSDVFDAWQHAEHAEHKGALIPEAQAVVQGLSRLARLEKEQIYAVLDVGAGTIDMGIFKFVGLRQGDRMPFWGARTHPQGCDDLDRRLLRALKLRTAQLSRLRSAKIRVLQTGRQQRIGSKRLAAYHLESAAEWLYDSWRESYSRVFGNAYRKQRNTDEWRELRTIVVGGGSLIPQLTELMMKPPRSFVEVLKVDLTDSMDCRVIGATQETPKLGELPFLIPAVGLSHIRPEMPEVVPPGQVEDDLGPLRGPSGLYDYEIGEI